MSSSGSPLASFVSQNKCVTETKDCDITPEEGDSVPEPQLVGVVD